MQFQFTITTLCVACACRPEMYLYHIYFWSVVVGYMGNKHYDLGNSSIFHADKYLYNLKHVMSFQ